MSAGLAIWQDSDLVARVRQDGTRKLILTYTDDALAAHPLGSPLLSVRLPLRREHYTRGTVKPFLDGLLPEDVIRSVVASRLNVLASDTFRLIAELGRDCAGALVIIDDDGAAPAEPSPSALEPLSEDELLALINNLGRAPLGIGDDVRVSLGGVQEKLLLTRTNDGEWARPVGGMASTHILKPPIAEYDYTVENEAFCMRLARRLGLGTAQVETIAVGATNVLVVERYDRRILKDGSVARIHQEDLCQALGLYPEQKYQDRGGPTLADVARMLRDWVGPDALRWLLDVTTLNVAIGNTDAHGKNFSLLHLADGRIAPAPLYDLMSTVIYREVTRKLAMTIADVQYLDRVKGWHLIGEAGRWGLTERAARERIGNILLEIRGASAAARSETPGVPDRLIKSLERRVAELASSLDA